jgi:hypothetical protein
LGSNPDPRDLKNLQLFDWGKLTRGRSFVERKNTIACWEPDLILLTASARPNFAPCSFSDGFPHFLDIAGVIISVYSGP